MIVSWNWLTDYVRLDLPVETLSERLALSGLNHESTQEVGGDLAIELEVTSNRPDCLGHLGVAREIAVLLQRTLREPAPAPAALGSPVAQLTSVVIEEPEQCPRFTARVVSGLTVGESPWWLRKRLETLGVRPISNLVDITNYVMFECGQPLHAYDLDRLVERRLVVRRAQRGEALRAINGRVYELGPDMLVIADGLRPVGLAGVMGGLDTEIGPNTVNVLIEVAQFDPMSVRRTSRALSLFSPSSYRFERPLDPERTEWASRRCAELILELAGGELHEGLIDRGAAATSLPTITLRLNQFRRVLGIEIERDTALNILSALGLKLVDDRGDEVAFQAPSWRQDLQREIDLIEEVARIHGYDHIPEDRAVPLVRSRRGPRERIEAEIREALTGMGLDEAYTFSLVPEATNLPSKDEALAGRLQVDHSSRRRENSLRVSLLPSLLNARAYNEAHGVGDAEFFEIAHVYLPRAGKPGPEEPTRVGLVCGRDYFATKGLVEALLDRLQVSAPLTARPLEVELFQSGRAAQLWLGDDRLGSMGEVSAAALEQHELRNACCGAELDLGVLMRHATPVPQYRPLPAHPAMTRDLSLVMSVATPWDQLQQTVRLAAGPLLQGVEFLDTFAGGDLPDGRHSLHFGLRFRHPDRTLTSDEVDRCLAAVIEACGRELDAHLRG